VSTLEQRLASQMQSDAQIMALRARSRAQLSLVECRSIQEIPEPETALAPKPMPVRPPRFPEGSFCPWPYRRDWLIVTDKTMHARVMFRDIIRNVCEYYGYSKAELESRRRLCKLVLARHVAIHLGRLLTPLSMPSIGQMLGGRDHTTILHAIRKINARLETDKALASEIAEIRYAIEREVA
jgi:hypothetical protein